MARRRFFVDQVRNGHAEITGEGAHHLTRVLRVEAGQKYEITDGTRVWLAGVEAARKSHVEFAVIEELDAGPELPPVTLYLALIKFDRFEWAIEKATEFGARRIGPFEAERSERGLCEGARKRVERWRRIAKEASEQSRRLSAPEILDPMCFSDALDDASDLRIWLDEKPGAPPLLRYLSQHCPGRPGEASSVALLIGPEGGWADAERQRIEEKGWLAASLGPFVLRAETAVCAALAVTVQALMEGKAAAPVQSKQPRSDGV